MASHFARRVSHRAFHFQTALSIAVTIPRSRGAKRPSDVRSVRPFVIEGAGKAGCSLHPQPRVQNKKAHERSYYRFTGFTRPSLRDGFNGFLRDLPGDRALLSPSSAGYFSPT
jgi:hypothetical protein